MKSRVHSSRWLLVGVLIAIVLASSVLPTQADDPVGRTIDSFWEYQEVAVGGVAPPLKTGGSCVTPAAGVLGNERDIYVEVTWSESISRKWVVTADDVVGALGLATGPGVKGRMWLTWDGTDDDPDSLAPNGLGGIDLTNGGSYFGIHLGLLESDHPFTFTMSVYSGADDWSEYTVTVPTAVSDKSYFLAFGDFTDQAGTGADFASVGAVVLYVEALSDEAASLDMVMDFIEASSRDFGDVPYDYNITTLGLDDGARHIINTLYLGNVIDGEADGQESVPADGDGSDEDGVVPTPGIAWTTGTAGGSVDVTVSGCSGTCYVSAWIDWDNNNDFYDAGDRILSDEPVLNGSNTITFDIPSGTTLPGNSFYARFRLYYCTTSGTASPTGEVYNGEVEDYLWATPTAVKLTSFTARPAGLGVLLNWETATEVDNAGFHLYRSLSKDERGSRLNEALIPSAVPGGLEGASYQFLDTSALPGLTYYYTLVDVDFSNVETPHGPVMVALWRAYLPLLLR